MCPEPKCKRCAAPGFAGTWTIWPGMWRLELWGRLLVHGSQGEHELQRSLCVSRRLRSRHSGNEIGSHFYPAKKDGFDWESVECSSTDNNTNWGANGLTPDADWKNGACYVNCACNQ